MKKNFLKTLFPVLLAIVLFSCEKELHKYEGEPSIYFNDAARLPAYSGEPIKDSTIVSFSLAKSQDSIINMVITATGPKSDQDRPYKLIVNPSSTAIEGVHYQILSKNFSIKKNKTLDTVKIKFFRKVEMQTTTFLLSFDLQSNENFATNMNNKVINTTTGQKLSFVNYRWLINDIIKKPARWVDGYLGTFSRKKLFLMVSVLGVDPSYLDSSVSIAELAAYGKFMQRYLNEQKVAGNVILEDNGSEMIMGTSVQ
ncbi:DUF4843 domain-containing protein [Pedobacter zeae]|uniref:DUF4843 domain-containing protein n=1 Tax=Pedobacter zeae TaxID=1737356 RepID=A0A7W6P732_9SPHI|nr:DUF4843 domain-containing protein [Pedobacter zeae]MBB4109508.1 hypothetical protein [Pedobacter zeae]GGH12627.1 hypothetical protein GCM10007422_32690 [Pedobacter zeae]